MSIRRTEFDDIRPYYDEEIPEAMERISKDDFFSLVAKYVYPYKSLCEIKQLISEYKTIKEFQLNTMSVVCERIIEDSISEFSSYGVSKLDKDRAYLYVSNHRDIMMDACLLEYVLVRNGFDTTEITFGANLMSNQFVVDIGKSNKMFKVERPSKNKKKFYMSLMHTSKYIRYAITEKNQSVWVAQRNGRTKNGNDSTNDGVIKMFGMSRLGDRVKTLEELSIVPIAVSYEWEPCDLLKTIEVYDSMKTDYVKKSGEDINSIITGVLQEKGRVHIEICEPLRRDELEGLASLTDKEYYAAVAGIIDDRIFAGYRLYPNNYIAYDILHSSSMFADLYSDDQKKEFLSHLNVLRHYKTYDVDKLENIYLGIYSNPLENKMIHK